MITVSVLNRKGGVGKTTIASNIVQALGLLEKRVLVIDNDEQSNMGFSLGLTDTPEINLVDVYRQPQSLFKSIYSTRLDTVDILPGSSKLSKIRPSKNSLKEILNNPMLRSNYDYCIIDNGPSMDELTLAAVEASHHYIIPVIPDSFAVQGLISLIKIFQEREIDFKKVHILVNRYQNNLVCKTCRDFISATYETSVLKTMIPNDNSLSEMVAKGKSILISKTRSKAVTPFLHLLVELFDFDIDAIVAKLTEVREKVKKDNFEKHLAPRIFRQGKTVAN